MRSRVLTVLLFALVVAVTTRAAVGQQRTITPEPKGGPPGAGFYANSWALVIGINAC